MAGSYSQSTLMPSTVRRLSVTEQLIHELRQRNKTRPRVISTLDVTIAGSVTDARRQEMPYLRDSRAPHPSPRKTKNSVQGTNRSQLSWPSADNADVVDTLNSLRVEQNKTPTCRPSPVYNALSADSGVNSPLDGRTQPLQSSTLEDASQTTARTTTRSTRPKRKYSSLMTIQLMRDLPAAVNKSSELSSFDESGIEGRLSTNDDAAATESGMTGPTKIQPSLSVSSVTVASAETKFFHKNSTVPGNVASLVNNFERLDSGTRAVNTCRQSTMFSPPHQQWSKGLQRKRSSSLFDLNTQVKPITNSESTTKNPSSRNVASDEFCQNPTKAGGVQDAVSTVGMATHLRGGSVERAAGLTKRLNDRGVSRKLLPYWEFVSSWQLRKTSGDMTLTSVCSPPIQSNDESSQLSSLINVQLRNNDAGKTDTQQSSKPDINQRHIKVRRQEFKQDRKISVRLEGSADKAVECKNSGSNLNENNQSSTGSVRKDRWNAETIINELMDISRCPLQCGNQYADGCRQRNVFNQKELCGHLSEQHPTIATETDTQPTPALSAMAVRQRTASLQSDSTGFDSGFSRSETCASSTAGNVAIS